MGPQIQTYLNLGFPLAPPRWDGQYCEPFSDQNERPWETLQWHENKCSFKICEERIPFYVLHWFQLRGISPPVENFTEFISPCLRAAHKPICLLQSYKRVYPLICIQGFDRGGSNSWQWRRGKTPKNPPLFHEWSKGQIYFKAPVSSPHLPFWKSVGWSHDSVGSSSPLLQTGWSSMIQRAVPTSAPL